MTSISVGLPKGSSTLGLSIVGSPPAVNYIDCDSPLAKKIQPGLYVQTLLVPDAEYSFFTDAQSLLEGLEYFRNVPRTLVLRDAPLEGPPTAKLTLPTGNLGIWLKGFPPVVVGVEETSPLYGRLPVGYVVDRLILSEKRQLSLASGGFTDVNVLKALAESSDTEGRVLVVNNVIPKGDTKSSNRPFDLGAFQNHSKWTLKRMFGKEDKKMPAAKKVVP